MDTALKQRLVGAAVLVALAVIFLPMLIKGPAPDSGVGDVPLRLPAAPRDDMQTRELPLVTPQTPGAGGALQAEIDTGRLPTVDTGAPPAAGGQPMMPPATAGGDYAVSFGSYATSADAARVVAALTASQLPGYQEPVSGRDGRTVHRVRIGPFATQADAESARLRAAHVRDDVGSKVVVLDASSAATGTAPAQAASASVPQPVGAAPTPSRAVALPAPSAGATVSTANGTAAKPGQPVAAATPPAKTPPAATPAAAAKPAPAAPQPAPAGAAGVGYAVQLGAFGNAEEADRLRDRARAAGFSAFVEQVRTDKGTLSRVRIGPVADRAEADRLRAQVSAKLGIGGIVRPHP